LDAGQFGGYGGKLSAAAAGLWTSANTAIVAPSNALIVCLYELPRRLRPSMS